MASKMKQYDVVKFHTPNSDEDPNHRYVLRDDPDEVIAHAAKLDKDWPQCAPHGHRVDIEYHGKYFRGKFKQEEGFFGRSIMSVELEDLVKDPDCRIATPELDAQFKGKVVLVKAPARKGKGKYVYIGRDGKFGATREAARRYDYDRDGIGNQVATVRAMGMVAEVEEDR
jgi:hypothetical protein